MATIVVNDADLLRADAFLTQYLTDKVPDADFSPGSAVRDLVVKSIAYVYALLEKERQTARDQASLLRISQLPASTETDAAVDAYLSTLFLTRKTGTATRMTTRLHFSQRTDVVLSKSTRFFRTLNHIFLPDITDTTVITASDLQAQTNALGETDYTADISLVAVANDAGYNLQPGRFVRTDAFNPFFTYAENTAAGRGGKGVETTAELLARAPTALSTRNLINDRSVAAVLYDRFPAITKALAIGMGDAEMMRDMTAEFVSGLRMHVGGHTDIYVGLPVTEVIDEIHVVGERVVRPDGKVTTLQDWAFPDPQGFEGVVQPGMVVNVSSGLSKVPWKTLVSAVRGTELDVLTPFPEVALSGIVYSVGALGPDYADVIPTRTAGSTSNTIRTDNCIALPGQPHYRVTRVVIPAVASSESDVVLTDADRTNTDPLDNTSFKVETLNPAVGQSAQAVTLIRLPAAYAGRTAKVSYDTLNGYAGVQGFVTGRFDRVVNANQLVRGFHPVYVSVQIPYGRRFGATTSYTREELTAFVTEYINNFDWSNTIDVISLANALKVAFPDIGTVYPFQLRYSLYLPDGQVLRYRSGDVATVLPQTGSTAFLLNAAALRTPLLPTDYYDGLKKLLESLGVSNRTVRYLAETTDVDVWELDVDTAPSGYVPPVPATVTDGAIIYDGPPLRVTVGSVISFSVELRKSGVLDTLATGINTYAFLLSASGAPVQIVGQPSASIRGRVTFVIPVAPEAGSYTLLAAADGYLPAQISLTVV